MAVETFIHATDINNQDESRSFVIVYFYFISYETAFLQRYMQVGFKNLSENL